MSKIRETFFGGAEKEAGRRQATGFREAGGLIGTAATEAAQRVAQARREVSPGLQAGILEAGGILGAAGERGAELAGRRLRGAQAVFAPPIQVGLRAGQREAALSGALGPEAQGQAFSEFQEAPGTQFLREQGLREVETRAAVTGGGVGERLRELTRFSQGLALQDLSRQVGQLGTIAGRGLAAAGTAGQIGLTTTQQQLAAQRQAAVGTAAGVEAAARERAGGILGPEQILAQGLRERAQAEAFGVTGAAEALAAGQVAQAAGLRGGIQQLAGGVVGGVTGGPLGALQGVFGV